MALAGCGDDTSSGGAAPSGGGGAGAGSTGGENTGGGGSVGTGGGGGAAPLDIPLDWYACPFIDGQNGECVTAEVPLDWNDPAGAKISFFVKRIPAAVQPARGQLWVLQGGPGYNGTTIEFEVPNFAAEIDDLDIYVPDHRGTGYSSAIQCPELDAYPVSSRPLDPADLEAAVPGCVADLEAIWGDGLKQFSATGAGRDLGELIERTREPGQEVFVYGVSYGTRWAHRYLQQFPAQPSGVIFDSIVAEPSTWLQFDVGIDAAAQGILAECAQDAYCSAKIGPDPLQFTKDLMVKIEQGHCPTSLDLGKADYKALLASLTVSSFFNRSLIAAVAYRIDRCDPTDQAVIEKIWTNAENPPDPHFSGALHFNVVSGELIETPAPTPAELTTLEQGLTISSIQMHAYRAAYDLWPRYDAGPLNGTFADTTVPILMMNGELDGQTTFGPAAAFATHYQKEHQTFVGMPRAAHAVIGNAPLASGESCGMVLNAQFLTDPTAPLDTSCKDEVVPLDFEHVGYSFGVGTVNVWDNVSPIAAAIPGPQPKNVLDRLLQARLRGSVR